MSRNGTGRCACGAMAGEDCDCPRVRHVSTSVSKTQQVLTDVLAEDAARADVGVHLTELPDWMKDAPAGVKPAKDAINPTHYKQDPSGIECIEVTRHRNFNVGNALKYLWRAGLKDIAPSTEDLRKAIWYLEDEIGRLEGTGTHAGQGEKKDV